MEAKLISFILLSVYLVGGTQAFFDSAFQKLSLDIASKNRLKFGEPCTFKTEQDRQKLTKDYNEAVSAATASMIGSLGDMLDANKMSSSGSAGFGGSQSNLAQSTNTINQSLRSIANLPGNLCNQTENLACGSTGTCACAEMDESTGFKVSYKREGDACVLTKGSFCSATEMGHQMLQGNPFRSATGAKDAFTCSGTEKCVVKDNGEECNVKNMEAKAQEKAKELQGEVKGLQDLGKATNAIMDVMRRGLCVCAGTNILSSIFLIALTSAAVSFL